MSEADDAVAAMRGGQHRNKPRAACAGASFMGARTFQSDDRHSKGRQS
jgi:hypothetical protein